jgi:hypothetical protein
MYDSQYKSKSIKDRRVQGLPRDIDSSNSADRRWFRRPGHAAASKQNQSALQDQEEARD